jgi:hypothetical protein
MVLYLLWIVVLTAPLVALTLTARGAPLRRATSGTGCVAAANDPMAATVLPEVAAGAFRRREHSREFRWGRGIVSITQGAGPPDAELTVGRRIAITEFSVDFVDVRLEDPSGHPAKSDSSSAPTRPVHPERSAGDGSPKTNISTLIAILRKESSCPLRSPAVD